MMASRVSRLVMATWVGASATPALAHDGPHHDHGMMASLAHLLSEPDHLVVLVIGVVVVTGVAIKTGVAKSLKSKLSEKLRALR